MYAENGRDELVAQYKHRRRKQGAPLPAGEEPEDNENKIGKDSKRCGETKQRNMPYFSRANL
jgi:hypothetical protein